MKKTILACILLFPLAVNAETIQVTAYHSKPGSKMASGEKISHCHYGKVLALSPDLGKKFKFGDEFKLTVRGTVYYLKFLDAMPAYHRKKIDLLLPSGKECKRFGRQKGELTLVKRNRP